MKKKNLLWLIIAVIIALALPHVITVRYYQHMLIMVLIWASFGTAWDLLGGNTGQVSFGHAAFFGTGAYAAGLLAFHFSLSPWWGLLLGPFVAALISLPIGLVCFKLRGPYFALSMLAVGEIFRLIFTNWVKLTNGPRGILLMPKITAKMPYYYMALLLLAFSVGVVYLLMRSRYGYYFVAIREDQDAAEALGIPTTKFKLYSLLTSAFLSGLVGAFYMNYVSFIDPLVVFSLADISIMVLLVCMMGGVATTWGPTIGAAIYVLLSETFRNWWGSASVLAFGILVCLVIMFLPNGVYEIPSKIRTFLQAKRKSLAGGEKGEVL